MAHYHPYPQLPQNQFLCRDSLTDMWVPQNPDPHVSGTSPSQSPCRGLTPTAFTRAPSLAGRTGPPLTYGPGRVWGHARGRDEKARDVGWARLFRACLVHCMWLNQAPRMQQLIVWLPASMFGSGSRGAKSVLQPGSADTEKSSVSRRPGSLDARGACGGAACGKNVKRSTPDPATKQRLSAACSDGRKQPNTHTLHAFSLGVQSLVPC